MSKRFEKMREQTEKHKHELVKCHVCGNEARIVNDRYTLHNRYFWSVVCVSHSCECTGGYKTIKEAINAWNELNRRYGAEVKRENEKYQMSD